MKFRLFGSAIQGVRTVVLIIYYLRDLRTGINSSEHRILGHLSLHGDNKLSEYQTLV